MFEPADLTSPERVEQIRRSMAMLPVGAPALTREDAMAVLEALEAALRHQRP